MQEIIDAPEWFEALTLAERAALLPDRDEEPSSPERVELAARKRQRWQSESKLLDDGAFAERLALDGLTPDRFLRVLAEPAAGWQRHAGGRPAWLEMLARAFSRQPAPLPERCEEEGGLGLLEILRPPIAEAHVRVLARLRRIAERRPAILDPAAVAADLLAPLLQRLRRASERALVLELHASRLEGRLRGETPEERFASFVATLREPAAALEILRRYPVLAREACLVSDQWVEASLEMAERFASDRDEIVRLLAAGADPGPVAAVRAGLSDPHAGGRSVAVLTFASGLRIVYKPKPLAIDLHFQELIAWLGERGASPPLRRLAILDRGAWGWMEHAEAFPCETPDEVERFYERQGIWVALFYALEATDFHYENLIAAGEQPVPIDLETLFQAVLADPEAGSPGHVPTAHTVLRSGLLPRRFWTEAAPLDLSGMGAEGGQAVEVNTVTDEGTDRMRWARRQARIEAGAHLPTQRGEPVALWRQGDAVLRGFRAAYRLLCRHREELLAPDGPLAPLAGLPARTLLRPTSTYMQLLHVGHHPDFLQNALDRDRLYDRLWKNALDRPCLRPALRLEQADLAAGDIPRFTALPCSTDLLHPGGRIEGFFARPGLELVRKRLREMDEGDLERQSWLVRAAVEATRPLDERHPWRRTPLPDLAHDGAVAPERFLAAARRIGDHLSRLALDQDGGITWFCLEVTNDGWRLEPMGISLYGGLPGVALFLAHLARQSGDERYERLARLALSTVRRRIESDPGALRHLGAYSGWGGIVYALTHLGLLWEEPELLEAAARQAAAMAPGIESDSAFDLIAGSAGAAAALLELHRHRPSPDLLELAIRCGDRLLAGAIVDERGHGWPAIDGTSSLPLTGFGHGTAGIAWALAGLARASGEERFLAAARGAIRYERSWFSAERESWPDLRESRETADGRAFFHAWCHGAPGIGLGRVGSLPWLDDPEMLSEVRAAVRATLADGFGFNHCLCHGDLGNLELVREAGRALQDEELTAEADRLAARILIQIEKEGPRCGASSSTEVSGLLAGLAGIGYGLLRAARPDLVPSVLLLETPAPITR